jgi:LmbE family N-acetylglucosaminyl deacetylase
MDMKTIYLSPHLDDAVYSCGGWIWEQTQRGQEVEIWTICAGDPPVDSLSDFAQALHQSWGLGNDAVQIRREEDREACRILGAIPKHLSYLDCIYRTSPEGKTYYPGGEEIFGGLDPREIDLIDQVSAELGGNLPQECDLIVPLGIGNHVDHDLTRKAAARLGRELIYYADYPYAREDDGKEILGFMKKSPEWQDDQLRITEQGLENWYQGARAYGSQITTFWKDEGDLQREIREFSAYLGGMRVWEALEEED